MKTNVEMINHLTQVETLSAEDFKRFFDMVDKHVIASATDVKGNIIYVNDKFIEVSQYSSEELIGKNHRLIKSGHHPPEFYRDLWKTISSGKVWRNEVKNKAKDGSFYWVDAVITPIIGNNGKPEKYLSIRYLISDKKEAEEKLKEQLEYCSALGKALQRSNEELQQFAHVASHDLQEPLRMVSSYVQLLEKRYKDKLDTDANDFIHFAVDGANRMQRLINDLLLYSRVGTKTKELIPINCEEVMKHVINNLKVRIKEINAIVTCDPLPTVLGDDVQLIQLFQNLIGNAIKFHEKETPKVHIKSEEKEKEYLFSVRDNGIGIANEFFESIFQPCHRLHTKEEYPGTGMGLAICKKIVDLMGGVSGYNQNYKKDLLFTLQYPNTTNLKKLQNACLFFYKLVVFEWHIKLCVAVS